MRERSNVSYWFLVERLNIKPKNDNLMNFSSLLGIVISETSWIH